MNLQSSDSRQQQQQWQRQQLSIPPTTINAPLLSARAGLVIDELSDDFHAHTAHTYLCGRTATDSPGRRRRSKTEKKNKSLNWGSRRAYRLAPPGWCRAAGVRLITPGRPLAAAGRQAGRGGRYLWSGAGLLIVQGVHLPH